MKEPAGVDNLIRGITLYKAFEYWADNTLPITEKDLCVREKLRREQEYLESLCDAMTMGGQ